MLDFINNLTYNLFTLTKHIYENNKNKGLLL